MQLAAAQRELERVRAAVADRAASDPAIEFQRARLAQINEDLRLTRAAKVGAPVPPQGQLKELESVEAKQAFLKEQEERALATLSRDAKAKSDRSIEAQRQQVKTLESEVAGLRQVQATATATQQRAEAQFADARGRVQGLRATELQATESALGKDSEERRKREEQFRREVAAATADPDSYAVGQPESVDPVLQCSLSVIGEGLIQIRGPVKGLNVIRTMINQIDAPVGQVRVGVHTVQVNGERVERMDKVVNNIQRYLDHSRFLTTQSAQMLRKAVTTVASRKAVEAEQTLAPGCTQADRDQKYLHCFFGKDFIDELRQLDSEFLKTGNKILSLHSMDSTSLSSALFLMALAKNDIRKEILGEFQSQLRCKLSAAEMEFFNAGLACPTRCEAHHDRSFCVLARNAKFASFFGFFDSEVVGNDTLTPVQREFVRLAQIFKSRMVTEMELKQRVMERALLEDRVGNFRKEQLDAKVREDEAQAKRLDYQVKLQGAVASATTALSELESAVDDIEKRVGRFEGLMSILDGTSLTESTDSRPLPLKASVTDPIDFSDKKYGWIRSAFTDTKTFLDLFYYIGDENFKTYQRASTTLVKLAKEEKADSTQLNDLKTDMRKLFALIRGESENARETIGTIVRELRKDKPDVQGVLNRYDAFRRDIAGKLRNNRAGNQLRSNFADTAGPAFADLQQAFVSAQASARAAQLLRRPLDEKKLLDMLVDDMEDKYIELLDGTRAHTANVDNYLKALSTALDDDFMTQFYQPAFRKIRTLGAGWDVQLGQIESTTVLTNNRAFGKVSPTASMEFDLPRRDILIKEAFKGAKAAVQDYGALLNDPVFLSLVKLYGGNPVGAQFGGGGGGLLPSVKNVLPGLPGSNRKEFGTNLEALIPDPAIYKIETGTGYEVRPVISPDGQAVVFGFDYMYTTDIREPVRADEKHLGRVKRHFVHTDVQLTNFEMREVSKYWVSLKVARTGQGVALLQDIPGVGALFRPAPSAGSSLQQNLIYSQAAIFPTLFDFMGLRYAPAVADLTPETLINDEFVVRGRRDYLRIFIFDYGASRVDDALRIMYGERRADLYRSQHTIPAEHPNGYRGPGLRQRDADLQEGYDLHQSYPPSQFVPGMHLPQSTERGRDGGGPFDPNGLPPGAVPIPPDALIPGHKQYPTRPGSPQVFRDYAAESYGTTVTREPPRGLMPVPTSELLKAPGPTGPTTVVPPPAPLPARRPEVPTAPASVPDPFPARRAGPVVLPPYQYSNR